MSTVDAPAPAPGTTPAPAAVTWSLWSTTARLVVTDPARLARAREIADEELAAVEQAASRFRSDSEVENLRPGADGTLRVSPVLADLLRTALAAAEVTDGAVDPTVGSAVRALGYDRDLRLVPSPAPDGRPVRAVVRPAPGWRQLHLDGDRLTVPAGVQLDLGATAKAAAADRVAARVATELRCGVLVGLGGDLATAGRGPRGGWQVLVQDRAEDPADRVTLAHGAAVATSSTVRRTWRQDGRHRHHIVDPATGLPAASPWRSVSVAALTCAEANALSTGAVVRGAGAPAWLRRLGRPARLVGHDGRVVVVGGWPAERAA